MPEPEKKERTIVETLEVSGSQLIEQVKRLYSEGNIRRLRITTDDDFALEMPVTVGVIVGGVVVLAAPWLAVLGVIAALITEVKVEVERGDAAAPDGQSAQTEIQPEKTDG